MSHLSNLTNLQPGVFPPQVNVMILLFMVFAVVVSIHMQGWVLNKMLGIIMVRTQYNHSDRIPTWYKMLSWEGRNGWDGG